MYTSKRGSVVLSAKRKFLLQVAMTVIAGTISWSTVTAQSGSGGLDPLVKTSARRLAIAEQVALSKWDSGAAVENATREAQVIQGAVKAGEARGVDAATVTKFFKAQIEANKVVQYSLLGEWRRNGGAPIHQSIDLAGVIRPELDQLQAELVSELADTMQIRSGPNCRVEMAHAIGQYVAAHRKETSALTEIALDRALSESCADPTSRTAP